MGMRLKWGRGREKEEGEEEGTKPRPHTAFIACAMKCTYSGTPLNGHPSTTAICDITDNSESPDCPPIHFNT